MVFNTDVSKETQEIVLYRKASESNNVTIYFNNVPVIRGNIYKRLGLFLDSKLNFFDHINKKTKRLLKE